MIKHLDKNPNLVWCQTFAFSHEHLQFNMLEVAIKDKDMTKDDFVGRVLFDMTDILQRMPPRQLARATVVPPRRPLRQEAVAWRDHAGGVDRHPGRRGVPGSLALGCTLAALRGPLQHQVQGLLLTQARLQQCGGHRGAGRGPHRLREGTPAGANHRQDPSRLAGPPDVSGAAVGLRQPRVE
jgi:hypothetical protein